MVSGSRALTNGPFDFLRKNDLDFDLGFELPNFFSATRDMMHRAIWGGKPKEQLNQPINLESDETEAETSFYEDNPEEADDI